MSAEEARAYSVWARLEREYALSDERVAAGTGGLLLPRHSRERFVDFLRWLMSDADRACSLDQVRVAVSLFTSQTQLTDWSLDETVSTMLGQRDGSRC